MKQIKALCLLVFAVSALLSSGCVADDLSECGISVRFQYVKNVEGIDRFATDIHKVTLFVFNGEGLYLGEYSEEGAPLRNAGYRMNVNLSPGAYRLVAWGNLGEEYGLPPMTVNETRIEDLVLSLRCTGNNVEEFPTHLFFGEEEIDVAGDGTRRADVVVGMMKNTNTVHVLIKGLPLEDRYTDGNGGITEEMPYGCTITSVNRHYKFDNTITGNDRLTYIPRYSASLEGQTLEAGFVTMREPNDGSTGSRLVIHSRGTTLPPVLLDMNLTGLLLAASVTGNLDIDDEFDLEIIFDYTNGTISTITINGWVATEDDWVIG